MEKNTKECYNEMIAEFKKLSMETRKKLIVSDLMEMLAVISKMTMDVGLENELLVSSVMNFDSSDGISEDEFTLSVYSYLVSFKEMLAVFLDEYAENNY